MSSIDPYEYLRGFSGKWPRPHPSRLRRAAFPSQGKAWGDGLPHQCAHWFAMTCVMGWLLRVLTRVLGEMASASSVTAAPCHLPLGGEGLGKRIVTGGNPWKGPHQCALHYGMTATGSHSDFDSLRGAPLVRNDMRYFRTCSYYAAFPASPDRPAEAP